MTYDVSNRRRPNAFEHKSNGTTEITIPRRNGLVLICVIDTVDYPLVKNRRWYADEGAYTYYAKSTHPTPVKMHQLLLPEARLIDHEDENGLNNRRSNLRSATWSLNSLNTSRKRITGMTSQFPGVYRHRGGKYYSAITIKGKRMFLGSFSVEKDAAKAYEKAKEGTL